MLKIRAIVLVVIARTYPMPTQLQGAFCGVLGVIVAAEGEGACKYVDVVGDGEVGFGAEVI